MPLERGAGPGTPGFGRNIATEERAGKPPKQAEAIAYREARSDADPHDIHGYMDAARRGDNEAVRCHPIRQGK